MQLRNFITIFLLFSFQNAFAQSTGAPLPLPEQKVQSSATDPRIKESYEIIDSIKAQNPPDHFRIEYRQGLMQLFANSVDSIGLNRLKSIPFLGLETNIKVKDNWSLELRGYYARNFLFETEEYSPNGPNAYQYSYDAGVKYRFVLDPTQIDDYVAIKTLYHTTKNDFKLSNPNLIYMNEYRGIILGVERSICVTSKIGILASLDLNFIRDAQSDTRSDFEKTGIGFMVRAAAHYKVDWFGISSRVGGAYWQGGFVNRLIDGSDAQLTISRTSHVQTFRAVSASYVVEF